MAKQRVDHDRFGVFEIPEGIPRLCYPTDHGCQWATDEDLLEFKESHTRFIASWPGLKNTNAWNASFDILTKVAVELGRRYSTLPPVTDIADLIWQARDTVGQQ